MLFDGHINSVVHARRVDHTGGLYVAPRAPTGNIMWRTPFVSAFQSRKRGEEAKLTQSRRQRNGRQCTRQRLDARTRIHQQHGRLGCASQK